MWGQLLGDPPRAGWAAGQQEGFLGRNQAIRHGAMMRMQSGAQSVGPAQGVWAGGLGRQWVALSTGLVSQGFIPLALENH